MWTRAVHCWRGNCRSRLGCDETRRVGTREEATRTRHAEMSQAVFRKDAAELRGDEAMRHLNAAMRTAWQEKENILIVAQNEHGAEVAR